MKPTHSCPVVGFTVGSEPWLSSQPLLGLPPTQKAAPPLITFGADQERAWSSEYSSKICAEPAPENNEYVTYRRSDPTTSGLHACGVCVGVKHAACTPEGRGPAVIHSLSYDGTLPFSLLSLSCWKATVPSPGWRTSPVPPQANPPPLRAIAVQGRVHVKPPFVERFTHTPLVSSVRLKLIWA